MAATYITCAMLSRFGDRCTGEALDETVRICSRHAAEVMDLVNNRMASVRAAKTGEAKRRAS